MTTEITDEMVDAAQHELSDILSTAYRPDYVEGCLRYAIQAAIDAAPTPTVEPDLAARVEEWVAETTERLQVWDREIGTHHKRQEAQLAGMLERIDALSERVEAHMHPVEGRRPYEVRTGPPYPDEDPTFTMEEEEMVENGVIQPHAFEDTPAAPPMWQVTSVTRDLSPIEQVAERFNRDAPKDDGPGKMPLRAKLAQAIYGTAIDEKGLCIGSYGSMMVADQIVKSGLAVSPDDPRLDTLEVSDEDVEVLAEEYREGFLNEPYVNREGKRHKAGIRMALEAYARRVTESRGLGYAS